MSSNAPSALATEIFSAHFGKVPNVAISMTYRPPGDSPCLDEMRLGFDMLETLLKDLPFERWDH